jgi:hypothetical protein
VKNVCGRAATALIVLGWTVCAAAQLTSDQVPRERIVPRTTQVEREIADSRYRLGPLYLQPRLVFRDFGYNDNVLGSADNPQSDWTATVAGGFRFITPMGRKLYLRGNALPEYTWYKELSDRRFVGGTYDAAFLALFNRMQVEVGGRSTHSISNVSSEVEAPAERNAQFGNVELEVQVAPKLSLFAAGAAEQDRYKSGFTGLNNIRDLNRDDTSVRGGARWALTEFFDVSLAAEQTRSEFETQPLRRDNQSNAVLVGLHYDRPKSYINLTAGSRKGKPFNDSTFPGYTATTGSYFLSHTLSAPIEFQLYGHRRITYGVSVDAPYFLETRNGAAVVTQVGNRFSVRAFGELGNNDYDLATRSRPSFIDARKDEAATYGGGVAFRVYRNIALSLAVSQTDYDSTNVEFDRSIVRFYSGLTFNGDFSR